MARRACAVLRGRVSDVSAASCGRRCVGPIIEQNSGEVKLKLPEDASEPMRKALRAMRAGLSASRYPVGFDGMVFAYYFRENSLSKVSQFRHNVLKARLNGFRHFHFMSCVLAVKCTVKVWTATNGRLLHEIGSKPSFNSASRWPFRRKPDRWSGPDRGWRARPGAAR